MKSVILLSAVLFSSFSYAQRVQNFYVCKAKTLCHKVDAFGERVIVGQKTCTTYGSGVAHTGYYAACNSEAVYGESVECSGFVKVKDAYDKEEWRWKTIKESCK